MCCDGHGCGCMGLPLHPPLCFKCLVPQLHAAWESANERISTLKSEVLRLENLAISCSHCPEHETHLRLKWRYDLELAAPVCPECGRTGEELRSQARRRKW
jgi:hypothetical protein